MSLALVSYPTWRFGVDADRPNHGKVQFDYPVGLLTLIAVMRHHGREPVLVNLDRVVSRWFSDVASFDARLATERVVEILSQLKADVFGFSTINQSYQFTLLLAQALKSRLPASTIVLGGPQATATAQATMEAFPFVDFVLCNEADASLPLFMEAIGGTRQFADVPGLTYRADSMVRGNDAGFVSSLDELPLPAYDLLDPMEISSRISLEAGRGCPFGCRFCVTNSQFSRRFRVKSAKKLVAQMLGLHEKYGCKHFTLIHDLMVVDRRWVREFCTEIIESDLPHDITWGCSARCDLVDAELLAIMQKAGCDGLYYGVESGSQRMQKVLKKNLNLDHLFPVLESTTALGISCTASFITGFPDETNQDQEETLNCLVKTQKFDRVLGQLHVFSTYSNTPYFDTHKDDLTFIPHLHPDSAYVPRMSPEELQLVQDHRLIFSNFYTYTHGLDPQRTKRVELFFNISSLIKNGIMLLLFEKYGSYMDVYERWERYLAENDRFQNTEELVGIMRKSTRDMCMMFVDDSVAIWGDEAPELATLVKLARAKWQVYLRDSQDSADPQASKRIQPTTRPMRAPGDLLALQHDPYKVLKRLRARNSSPAVEPTDGCWFFVRKTKGKVQVYQLTKTAYEVIDLCNGSRSLGEIQAMMEQADSRFSSTSFIVSGVQTLASDGFVITN